MGIIGGEWSIENTEWLIPVAGMSRILNGMAQFTVSVKVVVCVSDPEVAVTVTVDVTG
jgi:type II secretory pathway component PulL